MELHGQHLLGARTTQGDGDAFAAIDPRDGSTLDPPYRDASPAEIDGAMRLAASAHPAFERAGRETRARFLEAIADGIQALGDTLIDRASRETGLPHARFQGERGRTCGQLRLFAEVVREGSYLGLRIEHADPGRKPLPKPDNRAMRRALGPVVVFGASNFPLAFSVAGGDTASALAAGCPVVVKAHPNHPGTSELVGRVIQQAVREQGLPEGTFSLLHGRGMAVGAGLVEHEETRAVGFTGSLHGGRALFDLAAARPSPIPVFAEMGSVNPIFVLEQRLSRDPEALVEGLAGAVTLGVGQFCTNPGVVVVPRGPAADRLLSDLAARFAAIDEDVMLHVGIKEAFGRGLDGLARVEGVEVVHRAEASGVCGARPAVLRVDAATFLGHPKVHEEVFGPSTLVVTCDDTRQMLAVARRLDGQLTATVHAGDGDDPQLTEELVTVLEQKAGRVLFGGYPTGVDVNHAMVHGGPYPATTYSGSTSVGTAAIDRFTRPVCWQGFPQELLPEELRDEAPAGLLRLVDGEWQRS